MMYLLWQRYLYLAFDLHRLHPFHLPLLLHHDCPSLRYRRFQLKWYDRVQAKWIQNHSIFQSKRNVIRVSWIKTLNVVKYLHRLCLDQVQRVELCRKVTDQRQFVEWTLAKHKSKCSSDKIQKKNHKFQCPTECSMAHRRPYPRNMLFFDFTQFRFLITWCIRVYAYATPNSRSKRWEKWNHRHNWFCSLRSVYYFVRRISRFFRFTTNVKQTQKVTDCERVSRRLKYFKHLQRIL